VNAELRTTEIARLDRLLLLPLAIVLVAIACSCRTVRSINNHYHGGTARPVVAVTAFENLANVSGRWNLGEGMADLLVTELLESERVVVLERKDLKGVVDEIVLQGRDLFRKEGRVQRGRLKNAQYIVRGSVTDFTESMTVSGWFGIRWLKIFGGGNRARVAVVLRVSDVETGEVVSSVKASHSVSAGGLGAEARYKDLAFGGDAFFRTPLGKATEGAIRKAVRQVLRDLPVQYWQPRVAEAGTDHVVINGGRNVRVREGQVFDVREHPREITDPVTGNVIDVVPGRVIGRVQVTRVNPESSHGVIESGAAKRGDVLELVRGRREKKVRD